MSAAIDDRIRLLEAQIEGQTNPLWYYVIGQRPLEEALIETLEDLLEDYPDEEEIVDHGFALDRRDALEDVSNALAAAKDALEEDCDARTAAKRMLEALEQIEDWLKEVGEVVSSGEYRRETSGKVRR